MDPSVEMLKQAKETVKNLNTSSGKPVEFRTGGAQDLDFNLDASSVDLICAGTAGAVKILEIEFYQPLIVQLSSSLVP